MTVVCSIAWEEPTDQKEMNHDWISIVQSILVNPTGGPDWSGGKRGPQDHKKYSRGRSHAAICQNAWASRQVEDARRELVMTSNQSQNLVRAVFSRLCRGRFGAFMSKALLGFSSCGIAFLTPWKSLFVNTCCVWQVVFQTTSIPIPKIIATQHFFSKSHIKVDVYHSS